MLALQLDVSYLNKDGLILFFDLEATTDISGKVRNMHLSMYQLVYSIIENDVYTDWVHTYKLLFIYSPGIPKNGVGIGGTGTASNTTLSTADIFDHVSDIILMMASSRGAPIYFVLQIGKVKRIDSS